jgi:hypothetical protein
MVLADLPFAALAAFLLRREWRRLTGTAGAPAPAPAPAADMNLV